NTITVDQNGIARPLIPRSYTSFSQAMQENAESRVYLGIHFQFDANNGILQGSEIGNYVFTHLASMAMTPPAAYVQKAYRDLTAATAPPATVSALAADLSAGGSRVQALTAIEHTAAYRSHV